MAQVCGSHSGPSHGTTGHRGFSTRSRIEVCCAALTCKFILAGARGGTRNCRPGTSRSTRSRRESAALI